MDKLDNFMTPSFDAGNIRLNDTFKVLSYLLARLAPACMAVMTVVWILTSMALVIL